MQGKGRGYGNAQLLRVMPANGDQCAQQIADVIPARQIRRLHHAELAIADQERQQWRINKPPQPVHNQE